MNARALAGIEVSGLERLEQGFRLQALRLYLDEAAKGVIVAVAKMRVIGRNRGQAMAFVQQLVHQIKPVAAIVLDRAAMIVDFDGMRAGERAAILDRQLRPGGMGDGDEGAVRARPRGEFGAAFFGRWRGKIERETRRDNVPEFADLGRRRVKPGAEQGGEIIGAPAPRIGDWPIIALHEMIGELEEVIAGAFIGLDHLFGRQRAAGQGRMGVQIATPEPPRRRERRDAHFFVFRLG